MSREKESQGRNSIAHEPAWCTTTTRREFHCPLSSKKKKDQVCENREYSLLEATTNLGVRHHFWIESVYFWNITSHIMFSGKQYQTWTCRNTYHDGINNVIFVVLQSNNSLWKDKKNIQRHEIDKKLKRLLPKLHRTKQQEITKQV